MRDETKCEKCGDDSGDIRIVRFRVVGKAMIYEAETSRLCPNCRKAKQGHWMYADRGR